MIQMLHLYSIEIQLDIGLVMTRMAWQLCYWDACQILESLKTLND